MVLGFVGVLLIARPWRGADGGLDVRGVADLLVGSLSIGCSLVYARRFVAKLEIPPLSLCAYQIGFALCLLATVTPFADLSRIAEDPVALSGMVIGLGLTGTGVAYVLYYDIVQRMGAVQGVDGDYLPPIVALLIGLFAGGRAAAGTGPGRDGRHPWWRPCHPVRAPRGAVRE